MRRIVVPVAAAVVMAMTALPAWGAVDSNPNAIEFTDVECEGGVSFDSAWTPTIQAVVARVPEAKAGGIATSVYVTDAGGNPLFQVFARPGVGLAARTVWCFWEDASTPTGFAGGDIILTGKRDT